nr:ATP-binding protein [uncultured Draconibacterium sp.]
MITENKLKILIEAQESSVLDFKTKMYDFSDKEKATSDFVKDVICMSNTIRKESSFIIIGVEEKDNGEKVFHGLDADIDDAILQDKVKNKVYPRPVFSYYKLKCLEKEFGIIEFPVTKYSAPLTPTSKLRGLEIGKVYYRHGTSNSEALGHETIKINDWLQSLPSLNSGKSIQEKLSSILQKLTLGESKLSVILAELYGIGKEFKENKIIDFCSLELQGPAKEIIDKDAEKFKYRLVKCFISIDTIEISPFATEDLIRQEMKKSDDFFDFKLLFSHSITDIEKSIDKIVNSPNTVFATIKMSSRQILPNSNGKEYPLTAFIFKDDFVNLYQNIRQKTIDLIMTI